jgi:RNA polymerase sigma-70 factor (ECF subfamily)
VIAAPRDPPSGRSAHRCQHPDIPADFAIAPMAWRFRGTDRDAVRAMADEMLGVARPPERLEAGEIDDRTRRLATAGDRDACRALVEMYQVRVFALASRMLAGRGRATVEDVAQDAFLQVFVRLAGWNPGGSARLSTWILTITARRAIDELRKQRPALLPDVERTSEVRSDEGAIRKELIAAIEGALRELSPELRAAFLLREYHGLDYAEIASALSIELGTVKSRLSRARAALRARLAEVHDAG